MNTGTLTILPLSPGSCPDPRAEPQESSVHIITWGSATSSTPALPRVPACSEPPPDLLGTHFASYQDVLLCDQQPLLPAERLCEVR